MKKVCISNEWLFSSPEQRGQITVDLPHDYSIKLPRTKDSLGGASNGFFNGTSGRYVKYFDAFTAEHTILDIDGAYMCTRVIFNENQLTMHPHGYTPFLVDLTEKADSEGPNKLEILTENIQPSTRWYSGSGLYRDVYLWTGGKVRIEPWDMFIKTESIEADKATVQAEICITSDIDTYILLKTGINNTDVRTEQEIYVTAGKNIVNIVYEVTSAQLWDVEMPYIYELKADIFIGDNLTDTHTQSFGIRTITADAQNGLLLNGNSIKLKGGCIHHDHGALGAAEFPAAVERKLTKLKNAGYNAVRIAHNPPSLALLEICDRMGMIVMDEAFDMWNCRKSQMDYGLWFADWWARDIRSMVMRDRNHPCVISYSIGNEITERDGTSDGAKWSKKLSDEIRKYDNTRLVTSGVCGVWGVNDDNAPCGYANGNKGMDEPDNLIHTQWAKLTEEYMAPLDIVGYNYLYERYEHDHNLYPDRVIWGSETHALNFYYSWQEVEKHSYVIGDFTWTAYDNLGEAGTGRSLWTRDGEINGISLAEYPWRTCYQGDFDLCGYRRPQSYFRESIWRDDCEPKIFTTHPEHYGEGFTGTGWHWYDVNDSWTFDDRYINRPVKAEVYTDADEIEFILNGKSMGRVTPVSNIASLDIPYERGELRAVSYRDGKMIKSSSLHTVNTASAIRITPERTEICADNRDLCFFEIQIEDNNGDRVPDAEYEIECVVNGGELMCVFSGNPANEDDYSSNKCHTFYGRALAVVRTKEAGNINLTVTSDGLAGSTVKITAK